MNYRKPHRSATCHPERTVHGNGLCRSCYTRELFRANPELKERSRRSARKWAEANIEHLRKYQNDWKTEHPEQLRTYYEKRRADPVKRAIDKRRSRETSLRMYGLDSASYSALLFWQHLKCAICGTVFGDRNPCIDHNHETGVVRGILCVKCNAGLGQFEDCIERLKQAIEYLHHPPANELFDCSDSDASESKVKRRKTNK